MSGLPPVRAPGCAASATGLLGEWRALVNVLHNPGDLTKHGTSAQSCLVELSEHHRLAPLLRHLLERGGSLGECQVATRSRLESAATSAKIATAVRFAALHEVVTLLAADGLSVVLLKGADLALHCYPSPELRPMADLDVLLLDLQAGERAFALLSRAGYASGGAVRDADAWMWSRHLPELRDPRTGVVVEIHGGLVYSPRDRRHRAERTLLEGLHPSTFDGLPVKTLRPEANLVYLLAHELVRHSEVSPRLAALVDVWMVIDSAQGALDWPLVRVLADRSGLAAPVALGLALMVEVGLLERCGPWGELVATAGSPSWDKVLAPNRQAELTRRELAAARHVGSWTEGARRAASMLFPGREFMRERYRRARWLPLPLLYAYRWGVQLAKLVGLLAAGWTREHPGPAGRAKKRGDAG